MKSFVTLQNMIKFIQIPASLNSDPELSERACALVMTGDVADIVSEAMTGVVTSVQELFNLSTCDHAPDHTPPLVTMVPAPLTRVADISINSSTRGKVRKAEDDGVNPKKSKRFRAARKSMDEEEGFRPYKPPPPTPGKYQHSFTQNIKYHILSRDFYTNLSI